MERKLVDIKNQIDHLKKTELKNVDTYEASVINLQKAVEMNQKGFYDHINYLYWVVIGASAIVVLIALITGMKYQNELQSARDKVDQYTKDEKARLKELRDNMSTTQSMKLKELERSVNSLLDNMSVVLATNEQLNKKIKHDTQVFTDKAGQFQQAHEELTSQLQTKVQQEFLKLLATPQDCEKLQELIQAFIQCVCIDKSPVAPLKKPDDAPEFV